MSTADRTIIQFDPPPQSEASATVVLERYRLMRRLGAGAFGVVWLALDERLDRVVAVKRIEAHDPELAARAEREAIAAARLNHPGIVALHEAGRDAEAVYLVSELVRGKTLRERLVAGELSDRDVARIGIALCDALSHAHTRGVIHRDIKPANVIIPDHPDGEAGIVKLTDFGIALIAGDDALTRTGDVVGTLAYMAPEQADGSPVSGQSDLYSLALVLYEAFSGVNPVRAPGAAATARRVGTRLPPLSRLRPELAEQICDAIDWAVQPEELDRGSLAELREALIDGLPQTDTTAGAVDAAVIEGYEHEDLLEDPEQAAFDRSVSVPQRLIGAVAAAALVVASMLALEPIAAAPNLPLLWTALCAVLAAALLPRIGALLVAGALTAFFLASGLPGWAVLLWAALLPAVLLMPRDPSIWLVPFLAPLLGLVSLALAFPALAGFSAGAKQRAALAGLGFWWLALAEPIANSRLLFGDLPLKAGWAGSAAAGGDVVIEIIIHGVPLVALVWAVAAWILPSITASRLVVVQLAAAVAWAAALCAASVILAGALNWPLQMPQSGVLVAGGALAALLALASATVRENR